MAIHTVRDYLLQNTSGTGRTWVPSYLLAIFMRRVLGYSYVGDTNYPINAVGTLLIATADSTPTVAPTFAANTKAGINQGASREFYVWIPPATRTVQLADVGRVLVLKSTANSTFNSGAYVITGYEALNLTVQSTSGAASNPTTITTTTNHTLTSGQTVTLSGVTGNSNANGTFTATVTGLNTFTIPVTSSGTGSAGTVLTNCYIIDYRTMGSFPPQESFDSMNWYLYAADSLAPVSGAPNSTWPTTYGGNGNSTTPRIVLQSPHALGWQTRICHETYNDYSRNFNSNSATGSVPSLTASPGFGGNSFGDFAIAGPHLHTGIFYSGQYDASAYGSNTIIGSTCIGFGEVSVNQGGTSQYRITIVGDDTGQGVVMVGRKQFNTSAPRSFIVALGLPENEPAPLPVNNTARLFCIGSGVSSTTNGDYGNSSNNVGFTPGNAFATNGNYTENNTCQGISQALGGIPCACVPALWSYATGSGNYGGPPFDGSAGDSPWANGTELFPIDLINGTWTNFNSQTGFTPILPLEPRIIGTMPHVRNGRANYDEYAVTNDPSHAWQHMRNGIYLTWNGPQVVP